MTLQGEGEREKEKEEEEAEKGGEEEEHEVEIIEMVQQCDLQLSDFIPAPRVLVSLLWPLHLPLTGRSEQGCLKAQVANQRLHPLAELP